METGKKRNYGKVIYVAVDSILEALAISNKQHGAHLNEIKLITFIDYEKGRDLKYQPNNRKRSVINVKGFHTK